MKRCFGPPSPQVRTTFFLSSCICHSCHQWMLSILSHSLLQLLLSSLSSTELRLLMRAFDVDPPINTHNSIFLALTLPYTLLSSSLSLSFSSLLLGERPRTSLSPLVFWRGGKKRRRRGIEWAKKGIQSHRPVQINRIRGRFLIVARKEMPGKKIY